MSTRLPCTLAEVGLRMSVSAALQNWGLFNDKIDFLKVLEGLRSKHRSHRWKKNPVYAAEGTDRGPFPPSSEPPLD